RAVRNLAGEVAPGDIGRGGGQAVGQVTELGLAGRVAEQQAERIGVGGRAANKRRDGVLVEVVAAGAVLEPVTGTLENGPVEVGLGIEVPVQQHPGDAGLGGHVVEAGSGESGAGEGPGRGVQDLLRPLGPTQPADRHRSSSPTSWLAATAHVVLLVHTEVYNN